MCKGTSHVSRKSKQSVCSNGERRSVVVTELIGHTFFMLRNLYDHCIVTVERREIRA